MQLPKLSVLIPTLNSAKVLEKCLESVVSQDYPHELVEIIVADGGSTDSTREIAKNYGAVIVKNTLVTGEAGKLCALKRAASEYCALIDSDNILPTRTWFTEMITPLIKHPDVIGSEPIRYTWRKEDGFITRYCAILGMNDPLVLFLGLYDRECELTNRWTEVKHAEEQGDGYLVAEFTGSEVPTIGANGTVFKTSYLKNAVEGDYLFDFDLIYKELQYNHKLIFIKTFNGIIHLYCESDISKFYRKQKRRVEDHFYYRATNKRSDLWNLQDFDNKNVIGLIKFIFSCLFVLPLIIQVMIGYIRKPDFAWLFHPVACYITLYVYSVVFIKRFFANSASERTKWSQ
jgi:glycosyltransferase involved in cell wall biosynthesis